MPGCSGQRRHFPKQLPAGRIFCPFLCDYSIISIERHSRQAWLNSNDFAVQAKPAIIGTMDNKTDRQAGIRAGRAQIGEKYGYYGAGNE